MVKYKSEIESMQCKTHIAIKVMTKTKRHHQMFYINKKEETFSLINLWKIIFQLQILHTKKNLFLS